MRSGFILVRAGETDCSSAMRFLIWVYFCTCGGIIPKFSFLMFLKGLFLYVWGKLKTKVANTVYYGFIFVRVGEIQLEVWERVSARVYSRTCGGNINSIHSSLVFLGLFLHVRGKFVVVE
jgi:hypothetical protein